MARVKRGTMAHKRRKHLLSDTKGFRWGRKSKYRLAKEALIHAWQHSFRDRKAKKRSFRQLWQVQINAAAREAGISFSKLISSLKKRNIGLDRKILAQLAQQEPKIFQKIIETVKR
ncbi:MAG: 50S ribosomal protein L20 [Candidatus Wildermuthbacteria bacterium]|nr:50S ribosomal protein L20 [Candidatus Wildermuthbacteria bacterium]